MARSQPPEVQEHGARLRFSIAVFQPLRRILRRRDHAELSDEEREICAAERERWEQVPSSSGLHPSVCRAGDAVPTRASAASAGRPVLISQSGFAWYTKALLPGPFVDTTCVPAQAVAPPQAGPGLLPDAGFGERTPAPGEAGLVPVRHRSQRCSETGRVDDPAVPEIDPHVTDLVRP